MTNDPLLDFEKSAFFRALSALRDATEYSYRIISDQNQIHTCLAVS